MRYLLMKDGSKHHNFRDLTGLRFGALTAVETSHTDGAKWYWIYKCDCGKLVTKLGQDVTKDLKRGGTPNCGCMTGRLIGTKNSTHGMSKHPAYAIWRSMRDRCRLPSHQAWANYGGRGITVCERWNSFENFWEDMGATYQRGLDLDRRDNNAGYSKENCRWVSRKVNALNKRNYRGVDIATIAAETGISRSTLYYRLNRGLCLTSPTPARNKGS
jgi:predicted DNA-binding transcriptional regulator AlpA